jgi:hypothetical protein
MLRFNPLFIEPGISFSVAKKAREQAGEKSLFEATRMKSGRLALPKAPSGSSRK